MKTFSAGLSAEFLSGYVPSYLSLIGGSHATMFEAEMVQGWIAMGVLMVAKRKSRLPVVNAPLSGALASSTERDFDWLTIKSSAKD